MSKTWRTIRPNAEPASEQRCRDEAKRWRADRNERLSRAQQDEKRIARAERYTDRATGEAGLFRIGSTVQVLA